MTQVAQDRHIYTVSQLAQDIKLILENAFGQVWVEGEVSNMGTSGSHLYFTLKDDAAILPAAFFSYANREIKFKIENGLKVICLGKISAYAPHGKYQIIVEKIEPKGIGSLQLALEQLKKKLEKEGLFSAQHKRPIPYLPARVGIVSSLSGAAIKDMLKVLDRRFKDIQIIIRPAQVQGENAKEEIAQAIADLNRFNEGLAQGERIEVMIVGRGGGSIEDLWAFNEELVARAIYNSKIPVISAVGHERDWSIADLVADVRAATPSVAAELVLPRKEELREKLDGLAQGLYLGAQNLVKINAGRLEGVQKKLSLLNPALLIRQRKEKLEGLSRQIYVRLAHFLELRQSRFSNAAQKLSVLSPLNILGRGYSITFKMPESAIIKDNRFVKEGDLIKTRLHKGELISRITEVKGNG